MEDFLRFLITPILTKPESLVLNVAGNQIEIETDSADTGRVIGRQGAVIQAIRTLLRTYCAVHKLIYPNITLKTDPKSVAN